MVVVPRRIIRFGYPKSLYDYVKEIEAEPQYQQLIQTARALTDDNFWPRPTSQLHANPSLSLTQNERAFNKIVRELAYLRGKADRWGGNRRDMHWVQDLSLLGKTMVVNAIQIKKTGHRYPGSGSWEDYEPPTFSTDETIKVLSLTEENEFRPLDDFWGKYTTQMDARWVQLKDPT